MAREKLKELHKIFATRNSGVSEQLPYKINKGIVLTSSVLKQCQKFDLYNSYSEALVYFRTN